MNYSDLFFTFFFFFFLFPFLRHVSPRLQLFFNSIFSLNNFNVVHALVKDIEKIYTKFSSWDLNLYTNSDLFSVSSFSFLFPFLRHVSPRLQLFFNSIFSLNNFNVVHALVKDIEKIYTKFSSWNQDSSPLGPTPILQHLVFLAPGNLNLLLVPCRESSSPVEP